MQYKPLVIHVVLFNNPNVVNVLVNDDETASQIRIATKGGISLKNLDVEFIHSFYNIIPAIQFIKSKVENVTDDDLRGLFSLYKKALKKRMDALIADKQKEKALKEKQRLGFGCF